ncbi:MAG TPA: alpha/beta fold hydrolase, partial [Streptosporangiaceae bacterium]|nr:alpha/beta fold hydrolase [Streptosporangiaceae bacterium]
MWAKTVARAACSAHKSRRPGSGPSCGARVRCLLLISNRRFAMTLAYDRVGSGPPLVLLHGVGHRRQAWNAVIPLLRNRRELILVDLPGHGESPPFRPG